MAFQQHKFKPLGANWQDQKSRVAAGGFPSPVISSLGTHLTSPTELGLRWNKALKCHQCSTKYWAKIAFPSNAFSSSPPPLIPHCSFMELAGTNQTSLPGLGDRHCWIIHQECAQLPSTAVLGQGGVTWTAITEVSAPLAPWQPCGSCTNVAYPRKLVVGSKWLRWCQRDVAASPDLIGSIPHPISLLLKADSSQPAVSSSDSKAQLVPSSHSRA